MPYINMNRVLSDILVKKELLSFIWYSVIFLIQGIIFFASLFVFVCVYTFVTYGKVHISLVHTFINFPNWTRRCNQEQDQAVERYQHLWRPSSSFAVITQPFKGDHYPDFWQPAGLFQEQPDLPSSSSI